MIGFMPEVPEALWLLLILLFTGGGSGCGG